MRHATRSFSALLLVITASSGDAHLRRGFAPELSQPEPAPIAPPDTSAERRTLDEWARGAQLFEDMGEYHREVSTSSAEAGKFFDQGMRFLWAFNHDEATRSFARAAQLDPKCASCYWGVALTLGPNYNMQMMEAARASVAWDALTKAQRFAPSATPVEQALIGALAHRYSGPQPLDPSNLSAVLLSYANEMRAVAQRFPEDLDVQTLFAESLMNTSPWKLWSADGSRAPVTDEIVATLEAVMARDRNHPGANHYFIHAVEASPHPEQAIPSAERIGKMMPAAGHLVHMPAHIMQRVGRYEEASEANRKAAAADSVYYSKTAAIDYYPVAYSAHNYQFLASAAAMEGRSAESLDAMRGARAVVSSQLLRRMAGSDWSLAYIYEAMIRFGKWDDILREPAPDSEFTGLVVGYLGARATALAAKGRVSEARTALAALDKAIMAAPKDAVAGMNAASPLFTIAALRAKARLATAEHKRGDAIALLGRATAEEDGLSYNEPADEFFPTRHLLGAELLAAGRAREGESVYREDLRRYPDNGWSLLGLSKSLEAQGRTREAAIARRKFDLAWKYADTKISASAF